MLRLSLLKKHLKCNQHFKTLKMNCQYKSEIKKPAQNQHRSNSNEGGDFYEYHPQGEYARPVRITATETLQGIKEIPKEIKLWCKEIKEKFEVTTTLPLRPGEIDVVWKFSGNTEMLNYWIVTSDSDHQEGFSKCSFTLSPLGKGLFSGTISTKVPKDGIVKKSGYCNISSVPPQRSFRRTIYHDWLAYSHLVLCVRGDGRTYVINLGQKGDYDLFWNDKYHFVLHTRGGPHWQITKIPFSKFVFSSKGRIQDKQSPIDCSKISNFGITIADKINGPFRLEIDYIGLEWDISHTEETAYEMYTYPRFFIV